MASRLIGLLILAEGWLDLAEQTRPTVNHEADEALHDRTAAKMSERSRPSGFENQQDGPTLTFDDCWIASMPRHLAISCICLLVLGMIADASAASTLKITCSGDLTNTRADGVTLGQCDLNFISVKQMNEIEDVCGIPGTTDTPPENQCRIRAVVSPDPSFAADHKQLYRVLEVWSVDKRTK